jgi:crotonobetainyl-CoA:carnitine CoA-transferase CaiB-like acyl-CoA transferase
VLDLGVIVVGAELGRLLADQGAEVIKVETTDFPDGARQNRRGGDISVTFCAGNRNKLGLGINLRTPRGKALFVKLVEQSDVLLSNFKPGTLESLGLNYAELRRINPRLIMADSSAFGSTGPWSRRLGYGPLVRAVAGLTAQWRYPDETDRFSDTVTVYPDHVAGRVGAVGVLSLLIRRMRTGHGGTVSVSQLEVILGNMAAQIAAGTLVEFGISAHVTEAADTPWGVFPCLGDDQWCVVTIRNDADWRALCDVMARGDLAADAGLLDGAGRRAARERIERAVCDWLANRTPIEAMDQLQSAGVPAGAMLRVSEMPQFSYFRDRGFFRETRHPLLASPFYSEVAPVRSARLPDPPDQPAPIVGQHTLQIARDFLGLDEAEIATLLEAGVLEAPRDQWADAKRPDGSRAK